VLLNPAQQTSTLSPSTLSTTGPLDGDPYGWTVGEVQLAICDRGSPLNSWGYGLDPDRRG